MRNINVEIYSNQVKKTTLKHISFFDLFKNVKNIFTDLPFGQICIFSDSAACSFNCWVDVEMFLSF